MSAPADKKIKTWQRAGAVVLALSVWQAVSWAVGSALLLPGPVTVLGRLCALAVTAAFRRAVAFSFCRIAGGFALALVLAFVLALAAGRWPVVEVLLRPYVLAIKAVPVASFIILALIWMRTSALPLFISFLMVFPILYTNVLAGLRSADGQLLEMARAFRVPWRRQLHSILLPAVEPFLLAGCAVALGMSWKAGVAAEVIGVVAGSLGERLYDAKIYLQTADLLAWTVVIVALSALFERLVLALLRREWHYSSVYMDDIFMGCRNRLTPDGAIETEHLTLPPALEARLAETAARLMARYNLGLLPVRGADGRMCGVVTDRDLVLRCMAAGQEAGKLPVAHTMSNRVVSVSPDDPAERAVRTMARERVRRLPVVEDGKLVGMVSLGDLARQRTYAMEAGECLGAVCTSVRRMDG